MYRKLEELIDDENFCKHLRALELDECVTMIGSNKFELMKLIEFLEEENIDFYKHITILESDMINPDVKEFIVPDNIISIGDYCFGDCEDLKTLVLNKDLEYIGTGAFNNCTSLKELVIPDKVKSINSFTFDWCTDLTRLVLGKGISRLDGEIFYQTGLKEIEYNGYSSDFINNGLTEKNIYNYSNINKVICLDSIIDLER